MTGGSGGLPDGWVTTTLGDARLDLSKSIDPRKSGSEMFELYSVSKFLIIRSPARDRFRQLSRFEQAYGGT